MNEVWKKPPVSFEAYQAMVGKEIGVSSWHLIDQSRINVYADVIEDHQFIHVDPERAKKETAFGNTIAHGFLTLSLLSELGKRTMAVDGVRMGINYGLNRVRFVSPVPSGSRVRGRFLLAAIEDISGGAQATWNVTVEREGSEKPCCVAEWLVRYYE